MRPDQQLSSTEPVVAVVVAAGSGSRLGASLPKALVDLDGVTLVRRSVDALRAGGVTSIVVTIPAGYQPHFAAALDGTDARLVVGGASRQDSVRIGLESLSAPGTAIVLVHDAARALVPPGVVAAVAGAIAAGAEAAVPVLAVVDSIRRLEGERSEVIDRAPLRAVQTPQAARLGALRLAHAAAVRQGLEVTDDAAACEAAGMHVTLVEGHRDAMKITEPVDLILALALLRERKS